MSTESDPSETSPAGGGGPLPPPPDPVINTGPPLQPEQPIEWQPGKWYSVTVTCPGATCVPNYNRVWAIPKMQTGMGLFCGVCGAALTVLAAMLLDPQPVVEE